MNDREYAICFEGRSGLDEIGTPCETLADAKRWAKSFAKGAKNVTIKLYEDGDLRHQWDLIDGKFKQYE